MNDPDEFSDDAGDGDDELLDDTVEVTLPCTFETEHDSLLFELLSGELAITVQPHDVNRPTTVIRLNSIYTAAFGAVLTAALEDDDFAGELDGLVAGVDDPDVDPPR